MDNIKKRHLRAIEEAICHAIEYDELLRSAASSPYETKILMQSKGKKAVMFFNKRIAKNKYLIKAIQKYYE